MIKTTEEWSAVIRQLRESGEMFESENYHSHSNLCFILADDLEVEVFGSNAQMDVANVDLTQRFLDFLVEGPQ